MRRIAQFFARNRAYDDLSREIQQHLAEKADELVEGGLSRDEAEATARREFGNITVVEEQGREAWGWRWLEDFGADLRYGARQCARNWVFTTTAVVTLALGIGANTAIFTAVHAVLLRPLPFRDANRLVLVSEYRPGNVSKTGSPLTRYRERAQQNAIFEETGGYWDVSGGDGMVFGSDQTSERLRFSIVTSSFFSMLGVQPETGRGFSPSEDAPNGLKVFIVSDALWRRALGGDPQAIGKRFRLDGDPYTLIGILPPDFGFPTACDIYLPIGALRPETLTDRVSHQFWMIGRLRPGATVAQAQAQLDSIQQRSAKVYPATDGDWRVVVRPLLDEFVGNVRASLWVLFAAVGCVLLIACANIVNLLLVRRVAREKEFAVRAALGAGRLRLLRQSLSETFLIVLAGTALALVLAEGGLNAIVALGAGALPRFDHPHISGIVLAFSGGLALAVTFLIGLGPGLTASDRSLGQSLQAGQRSGAVSRRSRDARNLLILFEVALTAVLLIGAGLMLRSFERLRQVDPGFRPQQLVTLKVALPDALYPKPEQRSAFLSTLLERLNSTPGITAAAATDRLPLSGERNWGAFNIVGRPLLDSAHAPVAEGRAVSANYFQAIGMRLLRGREFTEADIAQNHPVVVINRTLAERFWPGQDPIGQRLVSPYRPTDPPKEIIGIVDDVKDFALDAESPPEMYGSVRWWNEMNLVVRSHLDTAGVTAAVRSQVEALDKNVPVYDASTLDELVSRSIGRQRFELFLLAAFASIAVVLAMAGIYGLLAFVVSRRTQEIGVRLALGATPGQTLTAVLSWGMKLVVAGLSIGLITALLLVRLLRGLLFQVSPADPLTFAAVAIVVVVVGVLACVIPARRAMSIDPVIALRAE